MNQPFQAADVGIHAIGYNEPVLLNGQTCTLPGWWNVQGQSDPTDLPTQVDDPYGYELVPDPNSPAIILRIYCCCKK